MARSSILLILLLAWVLSVEGQVNRYMVFFSDKDNTPYSISNPSEYLSERSLNRRLNQEINIVEDDLPVDPDYVAQLESEGIAVYHKTKWMNGVLVQVDESQIGLIEGFEFVTGTELVATGEGLLNPDSASGRKFKGSGRTRTKSLKSSQTQNAMIAVDLMHNRNFKGQNMLIAVFDGGFLGIIEASPFQHIIDDNRIIATYDFVSNSNDVYSALTDHGTGVFSAIGGFIEGEYAGTAYEADFVLCITEEISTEYRIEEYNWLFAAEFADSLGVDIINTSLGYNLFDDRTMDYSLTDTDGQTAIITRASNIAAQKGMLLVVSAGNRASWDEIAPPADSENVLAVGKVDVNGIISSTSSIGPTADGRIKPDVVAQGVGTAVINKYGSIVFRNGTSYSSPLVAGLAAGVWQANPDWTNFEVIEAIRMSGDRAKNPDNSYGYGIPDFIVAAGNSILSVDDILTQKIKVYPNPFSGNKIFIDLNSELVHGDLEIRLFNLSGKLLAQQIFDTGLADKIIPFETSELLPAGTYLLTVQSETVRTEVRLIKY